MSVCMGASIRDTVRRDPSRQFLGEHAEPVSETEGVSLVRCTSCGQLWRVDHPTADPCRAVKIPPDVDWQSFPTPEDPSFGSVNLKYRTFWPRVWAGLIDSAVFLPLSLADTWVWATLPASPLLVLWFVAVSFSFVAYTTLLHGFFGQTIGKRVTRVKVLDVSESKLSMKQAVLRESVYVVLILYGLVIDLPTVASGQNPYAHLVSAYASLVWFLLEILTMLSNAKRRAIHDLIARSVVVRLSAFRTEASMGHAAT